MIIIKLVQVVRPRKEVHVGIVVVRYYLFESGFWERVVVVNLTHM